MHRTPHAARKLAFVVIPLILIIGIIGISIVLARQLVQADGRINQIAHFGGDAIYCVDANRNPSSQLPTSDPKGFRLLNKDGQELWYVPGHDVQAALENSVIGGNWELIAEGNGTYGPTSLHTYNTGGQNGVFYVFTGYDEHGKTNSLTFQSCAVGSAVSAPPVVPSTDDPESTDETGNTPTHTPTNTETNAANTSTHTPTNTETNAANTSTHTPTNTETSTVTTTPTNTTTSTATSTATNTTTSTATSTTTNTATSTATSTATNTTTSTATSTTTNTATSTSTSTPTNTPPPS